MSKEDNQNNSIKMIGSNSIRQYSNEEANNDNILKKIPVKHTKFVDEKDENFLEIPKNSNSIRKKNCNII